MFFQIRRLSARHSFASVKRASLSANRTVAVVGKSFASPQAVGKRNLRRVFAALAIVALAAGATIAQAQTTYTVTRFDDTSVATLETGGGFGPGVSGDLRYGLFAAMAAGGVNTINFSCSSPPCTITLSAPLPPIFVTSSISSFNLIIDGGTAGNIIIDGNSGASQTNRVFFVDNVAVTLKNLVIQNATAQGGAGGAGCAGGGGGAGFGAGLFVNQSTAHVYVQNTSFLNMGATGGAGGVGNNSGPPGGGGGLAYPGGSNAGGGAGGGGGVSGTGGTGGSGTGGGVGSSAPTSPAPTVSPS